MSDKRTTIPLAVCGLLAAATLVAGCSGMTPGNPQPTGGSDQTASTGSGALPSNGAPKVQSPLDTSKFQSNICSVLTSGQLSQVQVTGSGQSDSNGAGPNCKWTGKKASQAAPGDLRKIGVTAMTSNDTGLSSFYRDKSTLKVFKPLGEIGGYPAVQYDGSGSTASADTGGCDIAVGVTDKLTFSIDTVTEPGGGVDVCTKTQKLAEMLVTTLKGGS